MQVFKTLELMGYERAKQCVHIPYGQVVLPSGKMSSRTGTVIMFSQLKELLSKDIYSNFLAKYDPDRKVDEAAEKAAAEKAAADAAAAAAEGKKVFVKTEKNTAAWNADELSQAQQQIAVATIKYGMLNHDVAKDIVFVLDEWTAKSGNVSITSQRLQFARCNDLDSTHTPRCIDSPLCFALIVFDCFLFFRLDRTCCTRTLAFRASSAR